MLTVLTDSSGINGVFVNFLETVSSFYVLKPHSLVLLCHWQPTC